MIAILDLPVLVLNRNWQPVQTCSVRRAMHLLCLGNAEVVQVEGEEKFATHDLASWAGYSQKEVAQEMIHSVRMVLRVPKVIVLALYDKLPRLEVKFSRKNIFLRDGFVCQYCEKEFPEEKLNLDHVIPKAKGGRTTWENIATSCVRCNTRKSNKLPEQAQMFPANKPHAPRWRPLYGLKDNNLGDQSWSHFVQTVKKFA